MIILDLSQVMIANLMAQIGNHASDVDEGLFRHMVLNSIRSYRKKFFNYGELVIACDDKNFWRKDMFCNYKANRKKDRKKSKIDWSRIFIILNKVRDELKLYFPYRVLQVYKAEADDIIASLVMGPHMNPHTGEQLPKIDKFLILSGDKDFKQLQRFSNVEQFDPVRKEFIVEENPDKYLTEHIIRGDRGDGIPNAFSDDNCIVDNIRQKPISKKKLADWLSKDIKELEKIIPYWERNRNLIDLNYIPGSLGAEIWSDYVLQKGKSRERIYNYMINNRMTTLIKHIGEF